MTGNFSVRHMLIALDTSPAARAGLGVALRLAARLEADVESLFVEDGRLLDLCGAGGLPTAHVNALTGRAEAVDAHLMEAGLRAQAAQLAAELSRETAVLRRACRLRSVRGPVVATLIAAAAASDLLVVSRRLRHVGAVLEATTRGAAISVLVLPEKMEPGGGGAVILAHDVATLDHALAAAVRLSSGGERGVDLWLGPDIDPAAAVVAARRGGLTVRATAAAPLDAAAFAARLPANATLVILAADAPILGDGGLRAFLANVSTPTLLIRRPA